MTLQDLGSPGELIAAIATVATLVYLALQIRANTGALKVESRRSEMQGANTFLGSVVESPDVARIFREGLAEPQALSPDDSVRVSCLLSMGTD